MPAFEPWLLRRWHRKVNRLFPGTDIDSLKILVSVALNFVITLLPVEPDLGCGHYLPGARALFGQLNLQESEWVISGSTALVELNERHSASRHHGDHRIRALLPLSRYRNLVARSAGRINPPHVLLLQRAAKRVLTLLLQKFGQLIHLFVSGVLADPEVELD